MEEVDRDEAATSTGPSMKAKATGAKAVRDGLRARLPTMHAGVRDELRQHSRYIRDNLVPLVDAEGQCHLNSRDMALLRTTLSKVKAIPVTVDVLRYSRIEKALMLISSPGWPAEIAALARKILVRWEDALGPLQELRADLWAVGGRLEGVSRIEKWDDDLESKSSWSVEGILDPARAYATGHLGFPIGAWWVKAVAAFRDGVIDDSGHGIIADSKRAYAIVMKDEEETSVAMTHSGMTRYLTSGSEPNIFKLTKTIASNVRGVVRVLRSWRLRSLLAPAAGLRYDGLYRVVSYGVTLHKDGAGRDEWTYCFTLQREPDQPSLKEALCHPTRDEIDDWDDYQLLKHQPGNCIVPPILFGQPTVDHLVGLGLNRKDSGYFSGSSSNGDELPAICETPLEDD